MEEIAERDTRHDNLTRYTTEWIPAVAIVVVLRFEIATLIEVESVGVAAISDYTRPIVAAATNAVGAAVPEATIYKVHWAVLDIATIASS